MPPETHSFRVVEKQIPNVAGDHDSLGVVKVQMPEQSDGSGSFRISEQEREPNL